MRSRIRTSVVSTLPTSTTNITGFRSMCFGFSLTNASLMARRTIGGSKSGRFLRLDISEHLAAQHREVLDERPERERREESQGADDEDHADEENHEEWTGDWKRPRRLRGELTV